MLKASSISLLLTALPLAAQVPGINPPPPAPPVPAEPIPPQPPLVPPVETPPAPAPAPAEPNAAAPQIETILQTPGISVGEETQLNFQIIGVPASPPQSIAVSGLDIRLVGMNTSPVSVGGQIRQITQLTYSIEALEAGEKTIPEQVFAVSGLSVKSKAVTLTVKEANPIEDALQPQAQVSVAKTEMWEGEAVQVNVRVLMHRAINIISQPFPTFTSDGIAVSRFDRSGMDMLQMGDELLNSWALQSALIPLKSGQLKLGPAEVKLEVYMPMSGAPRDPFGGGRSARRALKVKTNDITLNVKPLPEAGRPDAFAGAVGQFQVMARAESSAGGTQTVELGDPIGFEMMVAGIGNFDAVTAPVIEKQEGLRIYKARTSMENRGLGTEPGQKGFTQIIFPDKPGPLSIVYQLDYFDPQSGKYATAKSQPVQFIVTGDPAKIAAEQQATAEQTKDYTGIIEAVEPGEELQDILPHTVGGSRWYNLAALAPAVNPWLLHGAPVALLLALLGLGARNRIKAWQEANRAPAGAPRECGAIVADLRRTGLSRQEFYTFAGEYLYAWSFWKKQPVPSAGSDQWTALLAAHERWLYAANAEAAAAPIPADEQSAAVSTLLSRLSA